MKKMFLFLFLFLFLTQLSAQEKAETLEGKAPNFELEDMDGEIVELNDFIGDGPILLSFWATWCKPCIDELKQFNKIYEEYKDDGFNMIAISVDTERSIAKVKPFIKSKGYEFLVLLDPNFDVASRLFYARAVPFSVFINKKGEIIYSHLGYARGDEQKVESLVQEELKSSNEE